MYELLGGVVEDCYNIWPEWWWLHLNIVLIACGRFDMSWQVVNSHECLRGQRVRRSVYNIVRCLVTHCPGSYYGSVIARN